MRWFGWFRKSEPVAPKPVWVTPKDDWSYLDDMSRIRCGQKGLPAIHILRWMMRIDPQSVLGYEWELLHDGLATFEDRTGETIMPPGDHEPARMSGTELLGWLACTFSEDDFTIRRVSGSSFDIDLNGGTYDVDVIYVRDLEWLSAFQKLIRRNKKGAEYA